MEKKAEGRMQKFIRGILAMFLMVAMVVEMPDGASAATRCANNSFFGLKAWYAYLDCEGTEIAQSNFESTKIATTVWTVVLTVLNDLFFVAGILAVVLIIVSGVQFITSAGDPGAAAKAKKTLTGAIVGLVIVLLAQVIVNTILAIMNGTGF